MTDTVRNRDGGDYIANVSTVYNDRPVTEEEGLHAVGFLTF